MKKLVAIMFLGLFALGAVAIADPVLIVKPVVHHHVVHHKRHRVVRHRHHAVKRHKAAVIVVHHN